MAKTRDEIIADIKKKRPHLTDVEARQLLETLETFCELVINYTLKSGGDEEGNWLLIPIIISKTHRVST